MRLSLFDAFHPSVLIYPDLSPLSAYSSISSRLSLCHFHNLFFPGKSIIGHVAVNDSQDWGLRRSETTGQV